MPHRALRFRRHTVATAVLSAALLAGCGTKVVNPVTGQTERTVMSEADEIAEGKKAHQQVLQEYGVYDNAAVQGLMNEIGQRLAKQSHRANLQWTFTVLDSPEINAFALPGGYIYVTRGIMAYMASEADLAGVVGHEIGHVTARHGAQRATRAQNAGLGVLAATVLGAVLESSGVGGATQAVGQLSQTAAAGYVARYSREQESQADALGAEYLQRNRYDPRNMVDVIRLLLNQERFAADAARAEGRTPRSGNDWLASHPANEQRLADIERIAAKYTGSYADDGTQRFMKAIEGMAFGEDADQGLTRGRNFYHAPLGIALTAPAGWKVQNSAEAVTLVNAAGDAGLVLRAVPAQAGGTHEKILQSLKVEPPSGQRLSLGGLQATRFAGVVRDAQGQAKPAQGLLVTAPAGTQLLLTTAARDAATLQRNQTALREAEASLRPLSDADRTAARPWTLRTVAYPRGGFAALAQGSPLGERAEAQLRLLNGFYPGGEPAAGHPVKTVVAR
ncbi:MAG: M48 family metalloprotease [Rubrivivax sp.]|nr:M48 family metalloprotease [Rubrivivax sp.]